MLDYFKNFLNVQTFDILTSYVFRSVVFALFQAIPVWFLWNHSLPDILTIAKPITYEQSFLLILLLKLLTRAWVADTTREAAVNQLVVLRQVQNIMYNCFLLLSSFRVAEKPENTQENQEVTQSPEIK